MKTISLFTSLFCITCASAQYDGVRDNSFHTTGFNYHSAALYDNAVAMALQSTGKILVISNTPDLIASISRFNGDGTIDTGFGTGGSMTITVPSASYVSVNGLYTMPDDRIVIGYTFGNESFMSFYGCMRLLADGSQDNSFGFEGRTITPVDPGALYGGMMGIALQPDGKVISYGASSAPGNADFLLFRLDTDGTLDTDFGTDGFAYAPVTEYGDFAMRVYFTPAGDILVAGYSEIPSGGALDPVHNDIAVAKMNMDGELDAGFGTGGMLSVNLSDNGDALRDIMMASDGSIYAGGYISSASGVGTNDLLLCKITATGELDISFDDDGWASFDISNANDLLSRILITTDEKILLAGTYFAPTGEAGFSITRCFIDGSIDNSFGDGLNGYIIDPLDGTYNSMADATLQPDGKILVAGTSNVMPGIDISVARYWNDFPDHIDENSIADVLVYPNPAHDEIYLKDMLLNGIFRIYDVQGQLIEQGVARTNAVIDISELAPGMYSLEVGNTHTSFVKR